MTKSEFIKKLDKKLKGLPAEDKDDALRFYEDYIEEAGLGDSKEIEKELGTPEEAARKILDDCMEKQINIQAENASIKNNTKMLWMVLLGIFASPIALPLILVAVILYFCVIIVMFSVAISVLAVGTAMVISGIALIPAIVWALGTGQKLIIIGVMLIAFAAGCLTCIGFYRLCGVMVRWITYMNKKILKRNIGRRAE